MHAGMGYMARNPELRRGVAEWFPPARSVVMLGFNHGPIPGEPGGAGPLRGRVARYAAPRDYHGIIRRKLRELLERIRGSEPEVRGKPFVDTSPVLERLYARRAGLGWVGKNTLLLSRRAGSAFFLAGLALDRELLYDEPATDHCGSCDRCLGACPTGAFPEPRVLDASRCIAYFTIEHRGPVPMEHREAIGDWVFGCDLCQQACPWNRFSAGNPAFPAALPDRLPLGRLAALTPETFDEAFAHTPLERAGREGLVRNALLAMGNSGDAACLPVLERFASHPDPTLSEQARWSLERLRAAPKVPC